MNVEDQKALLRTLKKQEAFIVSTLQRSVKAEFRSQIEETLTILRGTIKMIVTRINETSPIDGAEALQIALTDLDADDDNQF